MLMLYLMLGIPAREQLRMNVCSCSISRSRSGLCASIMAGCFSASIQLDSRNGGRAINTDTVFTGHIDRPLQFTPGRIEPVAINLRVAADVAHAIPGQVGEVR